MILSFPCTPARVVQPCYEAALGYALVEGLPVFPLNGKVPFAGSRGFYDATTREEVIFRWWKRWPQANIGIPTGQRSGWLVLDIDARHDGFTSLQRLLAAGAAHSSPLLPVTRMAATGGGGLHMIFAVRNDLAVPLKNATALGGYSGIDLRADGGYIVVAPSKHESGKYYQWLRMGKLAPFPDLLANLCHQCRLHPPSSERHMLPNHHPLGKGRRAGSSYPMWHPCDYLAFALNKAQVGSRHRYALFLACRLVGNSGLSITQAEPYLREYARCVPCGDHPYTEHEAIGCLQWAEAHATTREVCDG